MRDVQPPTIIYLPSSGGNGGSRITPEVCCFTDDWADLDPIHLAHCPQEIPVSSLQRPRRWENGCEGSTPKSRYVSFPPQSRFLVVKFCYRRSHPYARPVVRFDTPTPPSPNPEFVSTHPITTSSSNPNLTVELLKALVPALIEDPTSFEESISSICAAHNVDRSAISTIMQATRRRPSGNPLGR